MPRETPGTTRTAARFLAALHDSTEGYEADAGALSSEIRDHPLENGHSQIVAGPVTFHSLCERHALPFFGHAAVGYLGSRRRLAPSGLTKLVRVLGCRFTDQERVVRQAADTLELLLRPGGVAISLHCVHLCGQLRGTVEIATATPTTVWRGAYLADPRLQSEFLAMSERVGAP